MTNKSLHILYFASLAEQAGVDTESINTDINNLSQLYQFLKDKHQFSLNESQLAVAINHHIKDWHSAFNDGDVIAFIPPVAGG